MKLTETSIFGVQIIEFDKFEDDRGSFMEIFRDETEINGGKKFFVPKQVNVSVSKKNVIRGLHYSLSPLGQAKLIVVTEGQILDTVLDLRLESPSFGEVFQVILDAKESRSLLIDTGVAHGFSVLSESATLTYLLSSPYSPEEEYEINPLDSKLNIDWRVSDPILSKKDSMANSFDQAHMLGLFPGGHI